MNQRLIVEFAKPPRNVDPDREPRSVSPSTVFDSNWTDKLTRLFCARSDETTTTTETVEVVTELLEVTIDLNSIEEWVVEDREVELDIDWQSTVYPTAVRGRSVFYYSLSLTCLSLRCRLSRGWRMDI